MSSTDATKEAQIQGTPTLTGLKTEPENLKEVKTEEPSLEARVLKMEDKLDLLIQHLTPMKPRSIKKTQVSLGVLILNLKDQLQSKLEQTSINLGLQIHWRR